REQLTEVAEAAGAEQRVDHGVGEYIGIGVAREAAVVFDLDAADHKSLTGFEAMAVVADPHSQAHQLPSPPATVDESPSASPRGSTRRVRAAKHARPPPPNTQTRSPPRSARNLVACS